MGSRGNVLMKSDKNLIVRDDITAINLNKNIDAKYFGNPMMDFVKKKMKIIKIIHFQRIILLIGSRFPEALNNLDRFLDCLMILISLRIY